MDEQSHTCPSCGMPNPADAAFCATCGRPLAALPSGPVTSPSAASAAALPPPPAAAAQAVPPPPMATPPPAAVPPPMAYPPPAGYPPPMMAPVPFPLQQPLTGGQKTGQFFGGLGLGLAGFVAMVLLTIFTINLLGPVLDGSSGVLALVPIALFVAFIVVMSLMLAKPRVRWLGYGLLAALVSLPVIAVVGCIVILAAASRSG